MVQFMVTMDETDFEYLNDNSTFWARYWDAGRDTDWSIQVREGRFENMRKNYDEDPSGTWEMAYFLPDDWSRVMLVRGYLAELGFDCEILWDLASADENEGAGSFVILTNYMTESWKRTAKLDDQQRKLGFRISEWVTINGGEWDGVEGKVAGFVHAPDEDDVSRWEIAVSSPRWEDVIRFKPSQLTARGYRDE